MAIRNSGRMHRFS